MKEKMNIFNLLRDKIITDIEKFAKSNNKSVTNINLITLENPKDRKNGDLSTNAAMVLSKDFSLAPNLIAVDLIKIFEKYDEIDSCQIAGPGFINFKLHNNIWFDILSSVLSNPEDFGKNNLGIGQKTNVEFVSVNPTGPMHVGHARGAVFGDVLSRLMSYSNYEVTKEYYVNDAGGQIDVLAKSAYLRYLEVSGEKITEIPSGLYPGDYLIPAGQYLYEKFKDSLKTNDEKDRTLIIKPIVVEKMMELIKKDLDLLDVHHDVFFSEKTLHDNKSIEKTVDILQKKNLVYKGKLEKPKGMVPEDWEDREQLLFKSTEYGDDIDRPLQKSNGEWTYFAADIAYMQNKIDRGFSKIIMILGADHAGYVKRIKASISALSDNKVASDIRTVKLVNYLKNGEPFKMSKRAGTFVGVDDVVEAVGKDVTRFIMLTRQNEANLEFDLEKVTQQSKDNPVFYVQYAHARTHSIMENAKEIYPDILKTIKDKKYNLTLLTSEEDLDLIKNIALWPRIVEQATIHGEPHRIAFYLYELASNFHSFWAMGRENKNLKFIIPENKDLTLARLALTNSVSTVIKHGLSIFNVKPLDRM